MRALLLADEVDVAELVPQVEPPHRLVVGRPTAGRPATASGISGCEASVSCSPSGTAHRSGYGGSCASADGAPVCGTTGASTPRLTGSNHRPPGEGRRAALGIPALTAPGPPSVALRQQPAPAPQPHLCPRAPCTRA
ncbi:hypothetical protein ACGFX8_19710 [Streptomyces sp. NPDC048362]|uniref:hypothetical protein n=1 Tax=Streptomyces sp. NPDC048362 TaxID=3365539 RepID=UPI00371D6B2E